MKNIFIRFSAFVAAAVLLISCGSDDKKKDGTDISGEWKLESVGGVSASELSKDKIGGLDVYISFGTDGTFETFQRLVDGKLYMRYDGTYSVVGITATGSYSDGALWGSSYSVKVEGGETLVMSAAGEDCVYKKTGIPAEVRSQAVSGVDLKSVSDTQLPGKFL